MLICMLGSMSLGAASVASRAERSAMYSSCREKQQHDQTYFARSEKRGQHFVQTLVVPDLTILFEAFCSATLVSHLCKAPRTS
jgi:hypothetical protein